MINFETTYGFMDLMREKKMVPVTPMAPVTSSENSFFNFEEAASLLESFFTTSDDIVEYGFFDLLKDKGHYVTVDTTIPHSNDNEQSQLMAS